MIPQQESGYNCAANNELNQNHPNRALWNHGVPWEVNGVGIGCVVSYVFHWGACY